MTNSSSAYRWSAVALVSRLGIQVVGSVVIARILGPEGFGLASQVTAISAVLFVVCGFAFNGSLQTRNNLDGSWIRQVVIGDLAVFGLVAVGTLALAIYMVQCGNGVLGEMFMILVIAILGQALSGFSVGCLSRGLRFREVGIAELIGPLVGVGLGIWLALLGFGAVSIAWQFAVTELLIGVLSSVFAVLHRGDLSRTFVGEVEFGHYYSLRMAASQLLTQSWRNLDNVMIGILLGAVTLGNYSISYRLITVTVTAFGSVIGRVSLPAMRHALDRSTAFAGEEFLRISCGVVLIGAPACGLMFAWADFLVLQIFGAEWSGAVSILQVLSLSAPFQLLLVICAPALHVLGRSSLVVLSNAFLCIWVVVSVYALSTFGIVWVSAGIAVGCVLVTTQYVEVCRRALKLRATSMYLPLAYGTVAFGFTVLLGSLVESPSNWAVAGSLGALFVLGGIGGVVLLPHRYWYGLQFWIAFLGRKADVRV